MNQKSVHIGQIGRGCNANKPGVLLIQCSPNAELQHIGAQKSSEIYHPVGVLGLLRQTLTDIWYFSISQIIQWRSRYGDWLHAMPLFHWLNRLFRGACPRIDGRAQCAFQSWTPHKWGQAPSGNRLCDSRTRLNSEPVPICACPHEISG